MMGMEENFTQASIGRQEDVLMYWAPMTMGSASATASCRGCSGKQQLHRLHQGHLSPGHQDNFMAAIQCARHQLQQAFMTSGIGAWSAVAWS